MIIRSDGSIEQIVEQEKAYHDVHNAISEKDESALYACLRKTKGRYWGHEAYQLCSNAIESRCSLEIFQALLEHCAPL